MALINCPECNIEVSDKAELCPKCGYGIVKHFEQIAQQEKEEKAKLELENYLAEKEKQKEREYQRRLDQVQIPTKPSFITPVWQVILLVGIECLIFNFFSQDDGLANGFILIFFLFISSPVFVFIYLAINSYNSGVEDYKLSIEDFEAYKVKKIAREDRLREQSTNEYNRQLQEKMNKMVKCPTCNSYNTKSISTVNRAVSVGMVGLASSKIGKSMECKNCGYKW